MDAPRPSPSRRYRSMAAAVLRADVPLPARVYDYLLGGKDNYTADRTAGKLLCDLVPHAAELAWANRRFMHRVVAFMAKAGITQFLDIGPGFPTAPATDEIAQRVNPGTRVLYADNDPVVVSHLRALRRYKHVMAIHADVRHPEAILGSLQARELFDFTRPIGLLLTGVLHFLPEDCDLGEIVAAFRQRLAPGSYLAVSHVSIGTAPPPEDAILDCFPQGSPARPVFRSADQILRVFGGWPLVEPGFADVTDWRPDDVPSAAPAPVTCLGGVAVAPLPDAAATGRRTP